MAKAEYPLRYTGWSNKKLSWKILIEIFDEIWGYDARLLPIYPKVLGGVRAWWINNSGIKFYAESLDEIHKELEKETISEIDIVGELKNKPHAVIILKPNERLIIFEITSDKFEISDSAVSLVKKFFPILNKSEYLKLNKNEINNTPKETYRSKEKWFQKWWGQILIIVVGGLILAFILWFLSFLYRSFQ